MLCCAAAPTPTLPLRPGVPADHYTGLTDAWSAGPIYCTEVTARLVHHLLGVKRAFLRPLPLDTPTAIQGALRLELGLGLGLGLYCWDAGRGRGGT